MMESVRNYWSGLSARERKLLLVAGVLLAAVLLWLLARSGIAAGGDLARHHQAAVEREGRVAAKAAMLRAPLQEKGAATQAASVQQYLARSASEIGLILSRNDQRGDRAASIAVASGRAPVIMAWIAGLEADGLLVDALTITPLADGTVALTADLRGAGR